MVIRDLEKTLLLARDAPERLHALLDLAQAHAAAFHNSEGLRSAREAVTVARSFGDRPAIARAMAAATQCHVQRGDHVAAVATGLDALEACGANDLPASAQAMYSIASALAGVRALDLAIPVARRAVEAARLGGDAATEAEARGALGAILRQVGATHEAREELRTAAAMLRSLRNMQRVKHLTTEVGHCYRDQANAALEASRTGEARMLWTQALRIYRVALRLRASAAEDAMLWCAIAECECRLGEPLRARESIARALAQGATTPLILAASRLWESHVLRALGELPAAEEACRLAITAAKDIDDHECLIRCLLAQSRLNDLQGRFETASDLERRARDLAKDQEASLAALRAQLGPLWENYTRAPRSVDARAA